MKEKAKKILQKIGIYLLVPSLTTGLATLTVLPEILDQRNTVRKEVVQEEGKIYLVKDNKRRGIILEGPYNNEIDRSLQYNALLDRNRDGKIDYAENSFYKSEIRPEGPKQDLFAKLTKDFY